MYSNHLKINYMFLSTCLKEKNEGRLREVSNTYYIFVVFGAEKVKGWFDLRWPGMTDTGLSMRVSETITCCHYKVL